MGYVKTERRGCLTGARFSMQATLLKQGENISDPINPDEYGEWKSIQDPLTGDIVKIWVPFPDPDPDTPTNETRFGEFPCLARGIVNGGVRAAGTTEWFGQDYTNIDFVHMWTPTNILITKRDRVTNIRNRRGQILWVDEEFDDTDPTTPPKATVFNVNGVTPLFDQGNEHTHNFVLLERAENLGGGDI